MRRKKQNMSCFKPTMSSKSSNSNFDEHKWVIQIRRTLEEELEDESEITVCIFNVPKILLSTNPASFTPQLIAIGPYHHWSLEVYEMERYKLSAAKRIQKQLQGLKFQTLVEHLVKLEPKIRACYHKYIEFNGETLAWIMAIDACFLIEFLQIYAVKNGKIFTRVSSRMSHLVDFAGRKMAHNTILRDVVMLENQIPLFVLRIVLEFLYSDIDLADEMLADMLMGLFKELSPFNMIENLPKVQVWESSHLLDYLYDMIVPKSNQIETEIIDEDEQNVAMDDSEKTSEDSSFAKKIAGVTRKLLLNLRNSPVCFLKTLLLSIPIKVILRLPWTLISNLPICIALKQPVEYLFFSQEKEEIKPENKIDINKPPLFDEITIPSITELVESGIQFSPTHGSISTVDFDTNTLTFHLPAISLDLNTEVVLRNLVAYEASNASGPLIFTRYTELMNGIIDTGEDAKLLREKGIIINRMKSDEDVANMWNGMSKSIRLTKVPCLDQVIEDVNKYYHGRWRIKAQIFMKLYVFGSWKFLAFFAAILLLFLMAVQVFCSVYRFARVFFYTKVV